MYLHKNFKKAYITPEVKPQRQTTTVECTPEASMTEMRLQIKGIVVNLTYRL